MQSKEEGGPCFKVPRPLDVWGSNASFVKMGGWAQIAARTCDVFMYFSCYQNIEEIFGPSYREIIITGGLLIDM